MDCLVIGGEWTGPWLAKCLVDRGAKVQCWTLPEVCDKDLIAAWIGSGETQLRHQLTFGRELTEVLWEISRASLDHLHRFIGDRAVGSSQCSAIWRGEAGDAVESSPALVLPVTSLSQSIHSWLLRKGVEVVAISSPSSLERVGTFEYRVTGQLLSPTSHGLTQVVSRSVFIVAESFPRSLIAGLQAIWLPITLNRFRFALGHPLSHPDISLFHGGADFRLVSAQDSSAVAGSFRNLYQDKAYGIQPQAFDAVSEKSLSEFLLEQGLIAHRQPWHRWVRYASLSCDGLPLIGAHPTYPGVFLVSGFAGREENFFFEAAHRTAQQFVEGGSDPLLAPFSPKRLV